MKPILSIKERISWAMVVHTLNPNTGEAEEGESLI